MEFDNGPDSPSLYMAPHQRKKNKSRVLFCKTIQKKLLESKAILHRQLIQFLIVFYTYSEQ